MNHESMRSILRRSTSPLHSQLDDIAGTFDSEATYAAFAKSTFRFRLAMERALLDCQDEEWRVDEIAPLLSRDLDDLGVTEPQPAKFTMPTWTRWSRLGAHYVLEGSALGARLLVRRAANVGMNALFGARHLAHQSSNGQRWQQFLNELDQVPLQLHDEALTGAESTFRFALDAYSADGR